MLRELRLKHFKCFEDQSIRIGKLTLLTGVNASGKSSVIQALSLLHQSVVDAEGSGMLVLDGSTLELGTVGDVVDKEHGRGSFALGLRTDDWDITWTFGHPELQDRTAIAVGIQGIEWVDASNHRQNYGAALGWRGLVPIEVGGQWAKDVPDMLRGLTHIGAERVGPREVYPRKHAAWHQTVGVRGDRAPGAIFWFGDEEVASTLRHKSETVPTLLKQVKAWVGDFFPGVEMNPEPVLNANAVTVGFRTSTSTNFHRPQHVGYGVTHVLPILVAALRATNHMLLVENPEVHLHPAGQAAMGYFLARVAQERPVIIETHSDHVLNGVRRAVRDQLLDPDAVAIQYFRERAAAIREGRAQVDAPRIDRNGNIDDWPKGFFDQFDLDMQALAGLGG